MRGDFVWVAWGTPIPSINDPECGVGFILASSSASAKAAFALASDNEAVRMQGGVLVLSSFSILF
jgi:hypothetical protein